jgi:hypothetical protein
MVLLRESLHLQQHRIVVLRFELIEIPVDTWIENGEHEASEKLGVSG